MLRRGVIGCCVVILLSGAALGAAVSDVADTVMRRNGAAAVRSLLQQKVAETLQQAAAETDFPFERLREFLDYVNAPQVDGSTALHWAVRWDDLETTELLLTAGANVSAANVEGATPLLLAAINGNAATIGSLIEAGADPNAPLTLTGDTALMLAARTGNDRRGRDVAGPWRRRQRAGNLGRHNRADVGRRERPSRYGPDAPGPRRGRQCQGRITFRPPQAADLKAPRRCLPRQINPRRNTPTVG